MVAIASALVLSVGCESLDMPPMSRGNSPDRRGLAFESSDNATIDAYDLIVYDRIDRNRHEVLDTVPSLSNDYSQGKVKVSFRLRPDGRITDLKIIERTVNYRQTAACWKAIRKVSDLPPWPAQVRGLMRRDFRALEFAFYYSSHDTRLVREPVFWVTHPYGREVMTAIQKKWDSYLDHAQNPAGKGEVKVEFVFHHDGTVAEARVTKSSVSDRLADLCRQAVLDAGPFPGWPEDLRNRIAKDYRKMRITFYFEN
jgi:TonB family protein